MGEVSREEPGPEVSYRVVSQDTELKTSLQIDFESGLMTMQTKLTGKARTTTDPKVTRITQSNRSTKLINLYTVETSLHESYIEQWVITLTTPPPNIKSGQGSTTTTSYRRSH